jgi:hypothetical protein
MQAYTCVRMSSRDPLKRLTENGLGAAYKLGSDVAARLAETSDRKWPRRSVQTGFGCPSRGRTNVQRFSHQADSGASCAHPIRYVE